VNIKSVFLSMIYGFVDKPTAHFSPCLGSDISFAIAFTQFSFRLPLKLHIQGG